MATRALAALLAFALLGCAARESPIAADYKGPTATIQDTANADGSTKAEFFFVSEVDGKPIRTNLDVAREFGRYKGFLISAPILHRDVPVRPLKLRLEARVAYGAPIQEIAMVARMYVATDVIEIEPEAGHYYYVTGRLAESGSAVWLEDLATRKRVGKSVLR